MATGFNIHDQWIGDVMPQSGVAMAIGRNTADGQPAVPAIEVNSQLMMLHDTLGSGIIGYNQDELRLEFIPTGPTPSGTQPIVTAVYFDAYDNAGGQSTGTTAITVNLDTERANSHPEIFVLANDEIQINMAGVYEFEFRFTVDTTGNTRLTHIGTMERQAPGGSYSTVDGTDTYTYTRSNAALGGSATCRFILDDVVVGEKFRLRVVQDVGTPVVNMSMKVDASSVLIRKLA